MKPYFVLAFILLSVSVAAQQSTLIFYNKHKKPVSERRAVTLIEEKNYNDTCWEFNFYFAGGSRYLSIQFKDEEAAVRHGSYVTYRKGGWVDTAGYYVDGKRNNVWTIFKDSGKIAKQMHIRMIIL